MQELHRQEPVGSLSASLGKSLQQLAAGIGGQLQQRRQRQDNAYGLQQAFPQMSNKEAEGLGYLDPQTLAAYTKQKFLEPSRKSNYEIAQKMFGGGSQPAQEQSLASSMGVGPEQQMAGQPQMGQPQTNNSNMQPNNGGLQLPKGGQLTDQQLKNIQEQANFQEKNKIALHKEERGAKKEFRKDVEKIDSGIQEKTKTLQKLRNIKNSWETGQVVSGPLKQWADDLGLKNIATNPLTQAAGKEMWGYLLENTNNIKGFRSSDLMTRALMSSKPSEYNTKEGAIGILDTMLAFLDTDIKVDKLKADNIAKYGEDPLNAPIRMQERIQSKIDALDSNLEKKLSSITSKTAGFSSQSDMVEKAPDPKTFNTKDNGELYKIDGKIMGSDGTKWREAKYDEDQDGNPV